MDKRLRNSIIGSIFNGSFAGLVTGTMILVGVRSAIIDLSVEKKLLEQAHQELRISKAEAESKFLKDLDSARHAFIQQEQAHQKENIELHIDLSDLQQKYDLLRKSLSNTEGESVRD